MSLQILKERRQELEREDFRLGHMEMKASDSPEGIIHIVDYYAARPHVDYKSKINSIEHFDERFRKDLIEHVQIKIELKETKAKYRRQAQREVRQTKHINRYKKEQSVWRDRLGRFSKRPEQ
jgi:hypothetical protein